MIMLSFISISRSDEGLIVDDGWWGEVEEEVSLTRLGEEDGFIKLDGQSF